MPINNYGDINRALAQKADKKITVVVLRAEKDAHGKPTGVKERLSIPVEPNPMRSLGLVMAMGKVTAVQANSPAVAAGIRPEDRITEIDGLPVGDPMRLPDRLAKLAGKTVKLTIQRKGEKTPKVVEVQLRQPIEIASSIGTSEQASALGIAYQVLSRVESVEPGSPAAKAGMKPGDELVSVVLLPPDKQTLKELDAEQSKSGPVPLDKTERNWPLLMNAIQGVVPEIPVLPGSTVELTFRRQGEEKPRTETLAVVDVSDWFNPDRGLLFEPIMVDCPVRSIGDAFALGWHETCDSLTIVFRSVKALSKNKVSMRGVAGPWTIILIAMHAADAGTAGFLLFLVLLSTNLAVINFLPIPVLDGGHIMFLAYEGIRGKPADERVQLVLSYIGLILILTLMVWALGLDFGLFSRHVTPTK